MNIKGLKDLWNKLMGKGHERTVKAKKNIFQAVIFKGIGVLIGFLYVPLSWGYLGVYKYGIFLLFISLLDWFQELDLGIGNGLRNRLGETIADRDEERARGYVSTAYYVLGAIFSTASFFVIIACYFIPWNKLVSNKLEVEEGTAVVPVDENELMLLAMLMFTAFAIRFVATLVYQIFYALQKVGLVDMFAMIGKVAFLIIIYLLIYFTDEGSLLLFGIGKTFTFAAVPLIVGLYYFNKAFKPYKPSYKLVKREYFNGIFSLGMQFFLIKSSMIVIFSTNVFLITRFVGVELVPQYDAAFKYMSVFILFFNIITNQMWSANIEAYRKGEMSWMKNSMKKINLIWSGTLVAALIMVAASPFVYKIWLYSAPATERPTILLTFIIAISVCITTWVNSYNIVINGTGKVRLQMYTWIITAILNIPLCILFAVVFELGIIGIVLGGIVCMIPLAILSPIQVRKLLNKTDTGIWAK